MLCQVKRNVRLEAASRKYAMILVEDHGQMASIPSTTSVERETESFQERGRETSALLIAGSPRSISSSFPSPSFLKVAPSSIRLVRHPSDPTLSFSCTSRERRQIPSRKAKGRDQRTFASRKATNTLSAPSFFDANVRTLARLITVPCSRRVRR